MSRPVTPSGGVAAENAAVLARMAPTPGTFSSARPGQLRYRRLSYVLCAMPYSPSLRSTYSADARSPSVPDVRSTSIARNVRLISAAATSDLPALAPCVDCDSPTLHH